MKFRKRIALSRLFRLNLSKSGVSATFGPPGLNINVGKKGAYLNTGIPGTGIYDRKKIDIKINNDKDSVRSQEVKPLETTTARLSGDELRNLYSTNYGMYLFLANKWYVEDPEYYKENVHPIIEQYKSLIVKPKRSSSGDFLKAVVVLIIIFVIYSFVIKLFN